MSGTYPRPNSWIDQLHPEQRARLEEETSRAVAVMPELLVAILGVRPAAVYALLKDYEVRNELERRFAPFALHQLSQRFAEPT